MSRGVGEIGDRAAAALRLRRPEHRRVRGRGPNRQGLREHHTAPAARRPVAKPAPVGPAGPQRVLAQQARAHDRRVGLPSDESEIAGGIADASAHQLALARRVAVVVERGRAAGHPADVAGEVGGRHRARVAERERAGRAHQHGVGRDRVRGVVQRLGDRRRDVLRDLEVAEIVEQLVVPGRDDRNRARLRGQREARPRDVEALLTEAHDVGHRHARTGCGSRSRKP